MLLGLWTNYWEDWLLYHKCSFDGINKLIIVHPEVSTIDIKKDVYSDWKEWLLVRNNSKYTQALRVIGGDPIGGSKYAGDIYFLINNWQIYIDHSVAVTGIIYSDDGINPFRVPTDTYIVTNVVSNLVQTVASGSGSTAQEVWEYELGSGTAQEVVVRTEKKVDDNQALIISM